MRRGAFLLTVDVEETSIRLNRSDDRTAREVAEQRLPQLLELLRELEVRSTFFFTGTFARDYPDAVEAVDRAGHEVGCHGLNHDPSQAFDTLPESEQRAQLTEAARIFKEGGYELQSFRAPAARIRGTTIRILDEMGYAADSSVCSQRFDGPLSFGLRHKLNWLYAPRLPYHPSYTNPAWRGEARLLEVPISAIIVPFIGTTMRLWPTGANLLGTILGKESDRTGKPVVFLFHPNECVTEDGLVETTRRAGSAFGYATADKLRQQLKLRNLGPEALILLKEMLVSSQKAGFRFATVRDFAAEWDS